MTDGDALLAAIRAFPDEDVPRLAYADYLDEHEQPERAEFIRVQVELARTLVRGVKGKGVNAHKKRMARAVRLLNMGCLSSLPGSPEPSEMAIFVLVSQQPPGIEYHLSRGFVHRVTCPAADWLAHADAILASHPVQEVTLTTMPEISSTVTNPASPNIRRVRRHTLRGRSYSIGYVTTEDDERLAYDPWERRVVEWLLKQHWSAVKTWHLPPEPRGIERFMTDANLFQQGIISALTLRERGGFADDLGITARMTYNAGPVTVRGAVIRPAVE